jgi:hypothetical protein
MVFHSTSHASETLSLDMGDAVPVGGAFEEGCLPRCKALFMLTSGEWTAVTNYIIDRDTGLPESKVAVLLTNGGEQYLRVLIDRKIIKANCYQSMMGC